MEKQKLDIKVPIRNKNPIVQPIRTGSDANPKKRGNHYNTMLPLRDSRDRDLVYFVHDAIEGRREIRAGSGKVIVCVGRKIERGEFGKQRYVPVYKTQTF